MQALSASRKRLFWITMLGIFCQRSARAWIAGSSATAPPRRLSCLFTTFEKGDPIQVEIISFGPMGASVDIVGLGHDEANALPPEAPPLGKGLVLQREIHYFRQKRDNVDVILGEVLPAYVERVREESGRVDVSLRVIGGKAKADEVSELILERLEELGGTLELGDKSSPEAIAQEFPGVSKASFKRALSALYKEGKVQPTRDRVVRT